MQSIDIHQTKSEIQTYARLTGLLLLGTFLAIGVDGFYLVPRVIVWGDAPATIANIKASDFFFRMSFATHLAQIVCEGALSLTFYVVLKPVSRNVSLLAAFFGLLSTATIAATQMFYFVAPHLILSGAGYLRAFSAEQINALAMLSMRIFEYANSALLALWGITWFLRGCLMIRSGYLPWILGVFLALAGVFCVVRDITLVLAPAYSSGAFGLVALPGGILTAIWLLLFGINVRKWKTSVSTAAE